MKFENERNEMVINMLICGSDLKNFGFCKIIYKFR